MRQKIIGACHSIAPYRHQGIKKTERTIRRVFDRPSLHKHIAHYVFSCLPRQRLRGGVDPIPGPFNTVYLDFWDCTFKGKEWNVLLMICQLTKWAECAEVESGSGFGAAKAFLTDWVCRFGVP
eukprot:GHVN01077991.1.p1 GENE.GHVN01077991.1~~GHVN01077991.1.p1  ORF type:complete len:123 (+),score=7.05 GHVN01077991.1:91-459(+)